MKAITHLREGLVVLAVAAAFVGGAHFAGTSSPAKAQQSGLQNGVYVPASQGGIKFPGGKLPGGKLPGGKLPGGYHP